jgi:sec-independent protein translocase protein TatA
MLLLHPIPAFSTPGPLEMIIILGVAVVVFGDRLPEVARNLGKSLSELKRGLKEATEMKDDVTKHVRDTAKLDDISDEIKKLP